MSTATVSATITVKGDITGKGEVFVGGTVEGNIDLPDDRVTVEANGRVKGNIAGKQVRVSGQVAGDIEALENIVIRSTGNVRGSIAAPRIAVEDGAKFKGRMEMELEGDRDVGAATGLPTD